MIKKSHLLLFLVIPFLLVSAREKPLVGTWEGKVGKYPITACFDCPIREGVTYPNCRQFGFYYYNKYRTPININPKYDTENQWVEKDSNTWIFEIITDTTLIGKWVRKKTNDTLPIFLARSTSGDDYSPCASNAFLNKLKDKVFSLFEIDTIDDPDIGLYRTIEIPEDIRGDSWSTFELLGNDTASKKINIAINGVCPQDCTSVLYEYFSNYMSYHCYGSGYIGNTPSLKEKGVLQVTYFGTDMCLGKLLGTEELYYYDLTTGDQYVVNYHYATLIDPNHLDDLRALLEKMYDRAGSFPELEYISMDSMGFTFYNELERHYQYQTDYSIHVSYGEIMPFLTKEGKELVNRSKFQKPNNGM